MNQKPEEVELDLQEHFDFDLELETITITCPQCGDQHVRRFYGPYQGSALLCTCGALLNLNIPGLSSLLGGDAKFCNS